MAKCKWCGENSSTNKNGYCENCNDMIRGEILRNKEILEELAQKASPFLPDEEKDHIYQDTLTAYQNLMDFKRKQVPFFKSDPVEWANAVMKKLNLPEMESDVKKEAENKEAVVNAKSRKISIIITLASFGAVLLVVLSICASVYIDNYHSSLSYVMKQNNSVLGEIGEIYKIGEYEFRLDQTYKARVLADTENFRYTTFAELSFVAVDNTIDDDVIKESLMTSHLLTGKFYATNKEGKILKGKVKVWGGDDDKYTLSYTCDDFLPTYKVCYVVLKDVINSNGETQNIICELSTVQ